MNHNSPYSVSVARYPQWLNRTEEEAAGDVVLGFGFAIDPVAPMADRIQCDMVWGGLVTPSVIKSCLDTLCDAFGPDNIRACIRSWLLDADAAALPPYTGFLPAVKEVRHHG